MLYVTTILIYETVVYAHVSETKKRELMRKFESGL
jgi:hypothetical protein